MTRVEAAKKGLLTTDIKKTAKAEGMDAHAMRKGVADGSIVIARNVKRKIAPLAIGAGTRIKVNANIGTSSARASLKEELQKMRVAVRHGADAIMDLSTAGDLTKIRAALISECPVAVGTVPLYEMVLVAKSRRKSVLEISADEMFDVIESHCEQGVDFLTLHCGVTLASVERFKRAGRLAGAVSRGGTIMMEWLHHNRRENPLYADYDRLLDICAKYDVCVSLGDAFRPGALADATDRVQVQELVLLGELVAAARKRNVGVFVEGPGHVPLHQVTGNVMMEKTLCNNAPFYVLGPLVTDVSPGYDHISAAIGGALAGMAGADFLCYVTPAEHLRLPSVEDVREGVIASRIAGHAADIARGLPGALEWDHAASRAKIALDWKRFLSLCVDPDKARAYRASLPPAGDESLCSICGEFCAIKRSKEVRSC
jgi:phosphomethylpyrimidine synthase